MYFLFSNYLLSLIPHRFLSFAVSPFHLIFFYHTVYPLLHRSVVYSNPLREGRICCRIFSHVSWVNRNRFFIGFLGTTFLLWSQEQGISQCFPGHCDSCSSHSFLTEEALWALARIRSVLCHFLFGGRAQGWRGAGWGSSGAINSYKR